MSVSRTRLLLGLTGSMLLAACGGGDSQPCLNCPSDLPDGGLYATFKVVDETFHAHILDSVGIEQAMALWQGRSNATIPIGKLVCTPVVWNHPWAWYVDPETLEFAEITIEVCDGKPSIVEGNCPSFGGGSYCPWAAKLVELRDCRTDPSCPAVPR